MFWQNEFGLFGETNYNILYFPNKCFSSYIIDIIEFISIKSWESIDVTSFQQYPSKVVNRKRYLFKFSDV